MARRKAKNNRKARSAKPASAAGPSTAASGRVSAARKPKPDEHILLIVPGSQTTLAQLGLPESFTPARYRFPTRMFPAEKKGEFEPYKIREKRREVNATNGADKLDVEMKDGANGEQTQPAGEGPTGDASREDANAESRDQEQELKEEIILEEDVISDEGAVYPLRNGEVTDWRCFFALLTHIYNTLSPPFHTPILLVSQPVWTARDREILTQFIFEKFKTPGFCLIDSSVAACYAYGTMTATVIDIGHGKADVTTVVDNVPQWHGRIIAAQECGGESMTDRLEELLKPKGFTREMCEQLKRSNITEILPPGTPLPGSASTDNQRTNPAAAASTGAPDGSIEKNAVPRGPGRDTQTEGNNGADEDEGVIDVAAIVTSGNTNEFLAKREKEKAERAAMKKGGDQANKAARLPNSKREKATFQFEEFVRIDDSSAQYMRQRREIEVGIERFLVATPTKERQDRGSEGILEDLAARIHHAILSVSDATKRSDLWDSLIILGNGSRVKGFVPALLSTLTQKYMLSPSGTIFTSELPSNLSTPLATGGTNTPANSGQVPGPLHHPAAHGVNPLLVAATHANAPAPATPIQNDPGYIHRSTGHSQTPTSIKTLKLGDYFPEWKDQSGSNAPGATGAGGTTASSSIQGTSGRGAEEAVFLGAQVAAKVVFVIDQGLSKGFLTRVEYNESGPTAIHEFMMG